MRRAGHTRLRAATLVAVLAWVCGVAVRPVRAQPADTLLAAAESLARFEEARALAVDPAGLLYVVDAGRSVVYQLDSEGTLIGTLGGPGAEEGQFNEPSDIDPTTGLLLVVADAGNGRLQRFSGAFDFREALPVGHSDALAGDYTRGGPAGRPIAVITSESNATFAVDDARHLVLQWDAGRRLVRTIGGFEEGEGRLIEPVALALDPGHALFVVDRGRGAVLVYDLFGSYMRTLAEGLAEEAQAVTVYQGHLWVVLPHRLLAYQVHGTLVHVVDVRLAEPLVDVAFHKGTVYLLTRTRLLRALL